MTLLSALTRCELCDDLLGDSENIVATSHFIADERDPLWRFSDAAMHGACFAAWDEKAAFVKRYNDVAGQLTFGNGTYHRMLDDGQVIVERRG